MKNYREVAETVLKRRDDYQKAMRQRRKTVIRAAAGGGFLCLLALLGFGIYRNGSLHPDRAGMSASGSEGNFALSGSGDSDVDGSKGLTPKDSSADCGDRLADSGDSTGGKAMDASGETAGSGASHPAAGQETESGQTALLPLSYSSLSLPQGQVRPEVISEYAASSQSAAEILPFSEKMLSKSSAILEGRITDMYLKRYSYDIYDDKFGPKELYHGQSCSVVYELTVDKVWYGDESLSGSSVLIEDDIYLIDSYFSLKVGCSYVIPVSDLDQEKRILGEYAGGDLTRDGRYTSLYPHHPQIEVTADGDYIVTTDWETLCPDSARDILLDIPENSLVEYHPENTAGEDGLITTEWRTLLVSAYDMVYYYDKLKLVTSHDFFILLNRLIGDLPQAP